MARHKRTTNTRPRKRRVISWNCNDDATCQSCRNRFAQTLRNHWETTWWSARSSVTAHMASSDTAADGDAYSAMWGSSLACVI